MAPAVLAHDLQGRNIWILHPLTMPNYYSSLAHFCQYFLACIFLKYRIFANLIRRGRARPGLSCAICPLLQVLGEISTALFTKTGIFDKIEMYERKKFRQYSERWPTEKRFFVRGTRPECEVDKYAKTTVRCSCNDRRGIAVPLCLRRAGQRCAGVLRRAAAVRVCTGLCLLFFQGRRLGAARRLANGFAARGRHRSLGRSSYRPSPAGGRPRGHAPAGRNGRQSADGFTAARPAGGRSCLRGRYRGRRYPADGRILRL